MDDKTKALIEQINKERASQIIDDNWKEMCGCLMNQTKILFDVAVESGFSDNVASTFACTFFNCSLQSNGKINNK